MPHAQRISEVGDVPHGGLVGYIVGGKLAVCGADCSASHPIDIEGGPQLRAPSWSADSKQLAFIADLPGNAPAAQIWTASADGSAPAKHAELKGYVQTPRFSPDRARLAILFIEGMPRSAGPLQPMTPLAGVVTEKMFEQRIAAVDLSTHHLAQGTPA